LQSLALLRSREFYEEYLRRDEQVKTNNQQTIAFRDGVAKSIAWQDVRPGDILKVMNEEFFPCDMVLLGVGEAKQPL